MGQPRNSSLPSKILRALDAPGGWESGGRDAAGSRASELRPVQIAARRGADEAEKQAKLQRSHGMGGDWVPIRKVASQKADSQKAKGGEK